MQSGPSRTASIPPTRPPPQPSSTSSTLVASSSRQTAPVFMSPTWQAGPPPAAASTSSAKPPSARTDYNKPNTTMTGDEIMCRCNVPAGQRTVTGEKATKGKKFWTCDTRKCDFFQWVDEGVGTSVPAKRSYTNTTNSGTGDARRCNCNEDGIMLTTNKEGPNQGRKFWKCRKPVDQGPCGFFEWDDEPPRNSGGPLARGGGAGPSRGQSFNSTPSGACFKCGEEGHFASACPGGLDASMRSRSFGASANPAAAGAECFKCHQIGHYSSCL
ncbi:hypothetical protein BDN70DRAFT_351794 [Pholiota conissans]|uniref:Uncharacterized protein n=1 Tax=Pholiota conissans TaxID=109636 RepID=A0A9P6CXP6_9AGAR|nr:hypothetical protein BDN70DRAFT_351794 [Pholiota conissans]